MRTTILAVFVASSLYSCLAQVPGLGACPNVTTKANFQPDKYLGKWYEMERYFAVFELGGKCTSATYGNGENGAITVLNKQINIITGQRSNITGTATPSSSDPAKLTVRFSTVPFDAPYWIVDTDYDNYAVVWSCASYGFLNTKFSWILTRSRTPSLQVMQDAYKVIDANGISRAYFLRTNQQNCPDDY